MGKTQEPAARVRVLLNPAHFTFSYSTHADSLSYYKHGVCFLEHSALTRTLVGFRVYRLVCLPGVTEWCQLPLTSELTVNLKVHFAGFFPLNAPPFTLCGGHRLSVVYLQDYKNDLPLFFSSFL